MSGSNNNGFPSGETVKFLSGTTVLGTGTLSNVYGDGCSGTPCATFRTSALPAGNVKLTAQYAGDAVFAPENSAALIVPVAKMPTTTVVSASSSTGIPGTSVTLTAVVSPSNATDGFFYNETYGETVSFYAGSKLLGTAQLIQAQYPGLDAQLTTTAIPTGSNAITAVYGGDVAYLKSTSAAVNVSLSKIATTSMLTPATLGDCGTYVTLTMQVTSSIPSDPNFASYGVNDTATYYTTTGIELGTSPLTYISSIPGQVSEDFITKTLPCGGVSVYAVYSGDGLYAGSTSPTRYINLGPPPVIVWSGPAPVKGGRR